ncbi:MAG TPA: aminoglycoside phosphotransferase family protein [Puia sp.]|nr:aminoglycoside phosphotransferase family protein [Puia sp.]
MFINVLAAYGLKEEECSIRPFGTGLINRTFKISCAGKEYILQQINHEIFGQPALIAENIDNLATYLRQLFPEYLFIQPLSALDGKSFVYNEEQGYFRLSPFVAGSHTYDVVEATQLAYEAALEFGRFTKLLAGFPTDRLHTTLPDFHNLSLRYQQFETALQQGNADRIAEAKESIATIRASRHIQEEFEQIKHHPGFKARVTHHDTKISNVLFDKENKGICVIDLDTVMPGYFISDLGDMMRTYLSPVSEEEKDFSRINIREDYFKAIVRGYLGEMKNELSSAELRHVVYAGKFMIYMQAIRFLTDHLNNDSYYGAKYEGHNLVRANNQITLLQRLTEKETVLSQLVTQYVESPV